MPTRTSQEKPKKAKAAANSGKANALQQPLRPSEALAAVVGPEPLPRGEVVRKVWDYIKSHNLQNPDNRTITVGLATLSSGRVTSIPILMAGLDVTHQALVLPADVARLEALGTRTGRVFADLMRFFAIHHRNRYGWEGPPIHDAVAVGVLVAPWLVDRRRMRVDVETVDGLTRGRTVGDEEGIAGRPPNAEVGVRLDREAFMDLVVDAVARFP